jgi:hypothetical protein
MKMLSFITIVGISVALLQAPTAAAQQRLGFPQPRHPCPNGMVWQYGCVKYGPHPGQLIGPCLKNGWSCKRAPQQIQ